VDRVISAVGVVGNIEGIGLEKLGVKTSAAVSSSTARQDQRARHLRHRRRRRPADAGAQGRARRRHLRRGHQGAASASDGQELIPGCTYCHPQIASVGLTEAKAKEAGKDIRVGRFPFVGNGKAIALGEDQGLVKVIFDKKTGQLLGAHMVGRR
jgi:dihydrolipoamide dehydrogenase